MPKLNKTQKYAILWLYSQSKDIPYISEELGVSEKQVCSVTDKSADQIQNNNITTTKSSVSSSRSKNLMITETSGKKTKSVAIMTREASMLNDDYKNKIQPDQTKNTDHYIFRPNK